MRVLYYFLNISFAVVWLINGLYCKILDYVPRHQEIVGRILGEDYSGVLTLVIGFAEVGIAIWVLSGIKRKINAVFQIAVIVLMNILEYFFVPELLLFGKFNLLFALLFASLIYINEFQIRNRLTL